MVIGNVLERRKWEVVMVTNQQVKWLLLKPTPHQKAHKQTDRQTDKQQQTDKQEHADKQEDSKEGRDVEEFEGVADIEEVIVARLVHLHTQHITQHDA